eukprot:CAMPEP_0176495712 /NCGR_PEP_ID=MMETSP0200_2-20121128/10809_1 /TAXON_ID=947934 /ORGANISM="Chaetoceros sp., Strain GSL56" /LENGTH=621 /DNA_ID=CAMNT_0017893621 /DNA_START=39 /DNA_END=1904 /DNA_ORIENTATION=-
MVRQQQSYLLRYMACCRDRHQLSSFPSPFAATAAAAATPPSSITAQNNDNRDDNYRILSTRTTNKMTRPLSFHHSYSTIVLCRFLKETTAAAASSTAGGCQTTTRNVHDVSTTTAAATTDNQPGPVLLLVIDTLRQSVNNGEMLYDAAQEKAAMRLSKLQEALVGYSNRPILEYYDVMEERQWMQQQGKEKEKANEIDNDKFIKNDKKSVNKDTADPPKFQIPRGLFIHGHVGTGKTHLMDMFYQTTSIENRKKRRVHFHSFMQDVHKRIHALKQQDLQENGRNFAIDTRHYRNPIRRVAKQLAKETCLLCFDEFQVTDVADALILSQLFQELFRRGTVVVATSNRHPKTLYEGGLNRGYFLPFIDILCKHCIVHDMNHDVDYRVETTRGSASFFYGNRNVDKSSRSSSSSSSSSTSASINAYHEAIQQIGSLNEVYDDDSWKRNVLIHIPYNRTVNVPIMSPKQDMARFHFHDLCKVELGSSDYRAMAQKFKIVIIDEIPILTLKEHDEARRFITLIDELYEAKCALLCSAAVTSPDELFVGRQREEARVDVKGGEQEEEFQEQGISVEPGQAFGIDVAQSNGMTVGELASVQELSFAFRRAASRIREMTSKSWWEKNVG